MRAALIATLVLLLPPGPAQAWWDEGHMQIAYLAYKRLDPAVRDNADALLRLNPDYPNWIAGAPDATTGKRNAFIHAATWADDIKLKPDFSDDRITDPAAGRITGYADHLRHAFWHFHDTLYSPDDTALPQPDPVDAVTQLKQMIALLPPSSGASDDLRSYCLVWTLHLVGDLHQPLHAVARYTAAIAGGDRGGNSETVIPATGEMLPLHFYWDRIFGGYASPAGAVIDADNRDGGLAGVAPSPAAAAIPDPDVWAAESFSLARRFAYAPPIADGPHPVELTRDYETNARDIARSQAALAAARLANLLNAALR
jgi:hypothetical protein